MPEPRKFRMAERAQARRAAGAGGDQIVTAEDQANIVAFSEKVHEAIDLLKREIAAINDGNLAIVSEFYDTKASLLKWLELKTPLIEPFLKHELANRQDLKSALTELKQVVDKNSELLSRMAVAARTVVREVEKASNRNSLTGLYGQTGKKVDGAKSGDLKIDRQF